MATVLTPTQMATVLTPNETTIRNYILHEVLYDKELHDLSADDSLLETELLDSIAIMQIVAFCEQVFDIDIPEEELLPDHFESVHAIGKVVERRLAAKVT
jgi:methoxymalonate biosynthesis acyl carrier protein